MKKIYVLFIVIGLPLFVFSQSNSVVEKEILANEHEMWDRWSSGDPMRFAESFTNDATLFRWNDVRKQARLDGIEEIKEYLAGFVGKIADHKYEMVDTKIQKHGEIVIVTFEYHIITLDGESGPVWKATNVYKQVSGMWGIIHSHWSLVKST